MQAGDHIKPERQMRISKTYHFTPEVPAHSIVTWCEQTEMALTAVYNTWSVFGRVI